MLEALILFAAVLCLGIAAAMSTWVARLTLAAAALVVLAVWLIPAIEAV